MLLCFDSNSRGATAAMTIHSFFSESLDSSQKSSLQGKAARIAAQFHYTDDAVNKCVSKFRQEMRQLPTNRLKVLEMAKMAE